MERLRFEGSDWPTGWQSAGWHESVASEALYYPGDLVGRRSAMMICYWDETSKRLWYEVQENESGTALLSKRGCTGPTLFRADSVEACAAWWAIEQSNEPEQKWAPFRGVQADMIWLDEADTLGDQQVEYLLSKKP